MDSGKVTNFDRITAWIQVLTLIITIGFLFFTYKAYKEEKNSNILGYIPLISVADIGYDIEKIEDEKGVSLNLQIWYLIQAYGNTPVIKLCNQSSLTYERYYDQWNSPDTSLLKILNPTEVASVMSYLH